MIQLSQKETMLLKDMKSHEEWCIKKYNQSSEQAQDPALKQMFTNLAQVEQQHLNTINQILNGQAPMMNQTQQSSNPTLSNNKNVTSNMTSATSQSDLDLCYDLLNAEKYVSSAYNTTIFECQDRNVRSALNHIQKEEQEHGEAIFNYLKAHGGYPVQ